MTFKEDLKKYLHFFKLDKRVYEAKIKTYDTLDNQVKRMLEACENMNKAVAKMKKQVATLEQPNNQELDASDFELI
jgi:prefoldin subunit 5